MGLAVTPVDGGRDGGRAADGGRAGVRTAQHVPHGRCVDRSRRAGDRGRQPHGTNVLTGTTATAAHTAAALTDGYALAFMAAAAVLAVTLVVAWATLPSLRELTPGESGDACR